jgi:AAA ATPase domain/CHAD domain
MHAWLEKARGGECQVVFVTGEAGIGKTTLIETFARGVAPDRSVRICSGQCLEQYGMSEAYLPVLEAIRQLCRDDAHVVDVLRAHAPMWLMQMPSLITSADRELFAREALGATRERMLREMGEVLDALTAHSTLVFVLEDLHWSDFSTLDLISYVARRRRSAHLMVVGTYRPAELIASRHPLKAVKQELVASRRCEELPLEYLTKEAVGQHLALRFPVNRFPTELAALIHERTEGNPLFMVNGLTHRQFTHERGPCGVRCDWQQQEQLRRNISCLRGYVAFTLKPGKSIRRQLKRIARKELASAAERLLHDHPGNDDAHESRKSVKKVEALAKLLDQVGFAPPRKDLKRLRAARQTLSRVRDADAVIETFDRLQSRFSHRIPEHTSAIIRAHLMRRKSTITRRAQASAGSLARAGKALRKIQRAAKHWLAPSIDLSELPQVLERSFRASRKAMKRAQTRGRAPDFHDWRKRVKNLWYQLRLAERLVSGLSTQIEEFRELETALGEEHNLSVLRTKLRRDRALRNIRSQINLLTAMTMALEGELRRTALVLGTRLHELSPKEFANDLRRRLRPKGTSRRKPSPRTRGQAVA